MAIPGLAEMLAKRREMLNSVPVTGPAWTRGPARSGVSFGRDPCDVLRDELRRRFGANDFGRRTGYAGLVNQGATCYLNSLLQTMFMTLELRKALFAWRYNPEIHGEAKRCVPYQLQRLFAKLQMTRTPAVSTEALTKSFGFDSADAFRQQDVMECSTVLFEYLANVGAGSPLGDHVLTEQTGVKEAYLSFNADGEEFVHAHDENHRAVTIAVKGMPTVEAALAAHLAPTEISGYFAEEVQRKVDALKGERFKVLPKILTLHLGRYDFDMTTFQRVKTSDPVVMGELLDMKPFTAESAAGQVCEYELFSAMIHMGSAHGGHYFAYVKDVVTGEWLKFNDAHVSKLDHADVLEALGHTPEDEAAAETAAVAASGGEGGATSTEGSSPAADADAAADGTSDGVTAGAGQDAGAGAGTTATAKGEAKPKARKRGNLTLASKYAYMLVYRRKDGTAPETALDSDIPPDVRAELEEENTQYDELQQRYEKEKQMLRVRVFYKKRNALIVLHQSKPLREALEMAHAALIAGGGGEGEAAAGAEGAEAGAGDAANAPGEDEEEVPLERLRLRKFDHLKGIAGAPFYDLDTSLLDAGVRSRSSVYLESRGEGEDFPTWVEGGLDLLLVYLPEGADSFDFPVQVNLTGSTVGDLRTAAKVKLGIRGAVKLVLLEEATQELDDDSLELVGTLGLSAGSSVHVEPWDGESPSRIVSKFDKAINEVEVKFNRPDIDVPKSTANPKATETIKFDRRSTLGQLKDALSARLEMPASEFKLMKDYHRGPQIKDLTKSLEWAGLAGDAATLYLRRGVPLLPHQVNIKVYVFKPQFDEVRHLQPSELPGAEGEGEGAGEGAAGAGSDANENGAGATSAEASASSGAPAPPAPTAAAEGAADGANGAEPPAVPEQSLQAQAAAALAKAQANAKKVEELTKLKQANDLDYIGQVIVDREATCDDVRAAIAAGLGEHEGVPPAARMRLRIKTGRRPGSVFLDTLKLAKNAHPLRDGRGIVIQATAVEERFTGDSILLETRCWHPDTTVLEATKEIAVDKNTTIQAVKELLSTLCNGAVAPENLVMARAQRFHLKKLTSVPKLLWSNQPAKFDTIGDCELKLRNGSIVVYKDMTLDEVLMPKPKASSRGVADSVIKGRARQRAEAGFRIYTPEEQLERERKRKEENDKREKELAERLAAAERVKEAGAAALAQSGGVAGDDDRYARFTRMIAVGVPLSDVRTAMKLAGLDFSALGLDKAVTSDK